MMSLCDRGSSATPSHDRDLLTGLNQPTGIVASDGTRAEDGNLHRATISRLLALSNLFLKRGGRKIFRGRMCSEHSNHPVSNPIRKVIRGDIGCGWAQGRAKGYTDSLVLGHLANTRQVMAASELAAHAVGDRNRFQRLFDWINRRRNDRSVVSQCERREAPVESGWRRRKVIGEDIVLSLWKDTEKLSFGEDLLGLVEELGSTAARKCGDKDYAESAEERTLNGYSAHIVCCYPGDISGN